MSKNTEAVHLRMPKELKGKLQIEAALQRRSLADYCRIILEKSINDNSTK